MNASVVEAIFIVSIPNLALFFDNLEKNWKEADFNW